MRIETRFSWIIAFCFCFGVCIAGYVSYTLEKRQGAEEVRLKADMLLETGLAVRGYTAAQIAPLVSALQSDVFHPTQVPSYAAQDVTRRLTDKFPNYSYRERSLNPTNLADRASDWEVGLLREFSADGDRKFLFGQTGSGQDSRFYLARPIRSTAACMQCHSTPDVAPPSMVAKYGPVNGFGWKLGDVVGLQLVEVPTEPTRLKTLHSVLVTVGSLSCIFVLSGVVFLHLLKRYVTRPLEKLTQVAHRSSTEYAPGDRPFQADGSGQFATLHEAIVRLRTSVDHALGRMFERKPGTPAEHDSGDAPR